MKIAKKLVAAVLIACMALSLTGCIHKKNENAVTIGGVKFSSAEYLYALVMADTKARQTVTNEQGEAAAQSGIDYYSQKINKKNFVTYVKDEAMKTLERYAAISKKCKDNKITLSKEQKKELNEATEYYWTSYGYSQIFEPNGVGKATYKKCMKYDYLSNAYFESIYGKDGTNPVDSETVDKKTLDNYVLVDSISANLSQMSDTEKTETTTKFGDFVARLDKGEDFLKIYNEYYNADKKVNENIKTDKDGIPKESSDPVAQVLGSKDTDFSSDLYDTAKDMKPGEIKLYTSEDGNTTAIIVKKDLASDKYWMNSLYVSSLYLIKQKEFDKTINSYKKTLKVKKNSYALGQIDVKKITYGQE